MNNGLGSVASYSNHILTFIHVCAFKFIEPASYNKKGQVLFLSK